MKRRLITNKTAKTATAATVHRTRFFIVSSLDCWSTWYSSLLGVVWSIGCAHSRPGIFISVHLHAPPQHVDPAPPWWMRSQTILAGLKGDLCTILHPNFREFTFHALR